MRTWLSGIVGEQMVTGAMLVIVTVAIVFAFLVLFALFRGFSRSGIVGNNKTRQARLAVMDAASVDAKRRLVLIRRDDVEHLIMIGGPSDIVIEQNINRQRMTPQPQTRVRANPAQQNPAMKPAAPRQPAQPLVNPAQTAQRQQGVPPARQPASATNSPQQRPIAKPVSSAAAVAPAALASAAVVSSSSPASLQTGKSVSATAVSAPSSPAIGISATTAQPVSPALAKKPVATEPLSASTAINPVSNGQSENQLSDFGENLAMELGETLVAEEENGSESSLSKELDELLNEMTGDQNSRK